MWNWLKKIVLPPVFEDDEEKMRIAHLLNAVLWINIVINLLRIVLSLQAENLAQSLAPLGMVVAVLVGLLFFMRTGYVKAAAVIFITFNWILITLAIPSTGGVRGAVYLVYPTIVLTAGLLLGGRVALGYALASLVAGSTLFALEKNGVIQPNMSALNINLLFSTVTPNIILVAALVYLYDSGIQQMLKRTREVVAQQNAVLDSVVMGITLMIDRKFVWANSRMEEIFGYSGDELVGQTSEMLYPSLQDYEELGEEAYPLLAQAQSYNIERLMKRKDGVEFWCSLTGRAVNPDDLDQGTIWTVEDITGRKEAEKEREQLQQEVIQAQQEAIKELSTPVIPLMEGVIVMPLVGSIDTLRARDVTRSLLAGISEHQAKVVIVDITGVTVVDTGVVNYLNKTIQAAKLKGARTIVTGISDAVAETIVELGIDWSNIETLRDLQSGLAVALDKSLQYA
jgi:PAS domain S-box-containing protein